MLKDFNFFAPTQVVFGKQSEEKLASLIKKHNGQKVFIHYGGGSAQRSGLLDKVHTLLKDASLEYVELGGVSPNPLLSKVKEGIAFAREEKVDFVLAIGGGSVIDSAKAIAFGVPFDGDPWDFWDGKATPTVALPIGVILTIPAAGSEMSSSCVITNDDGMLKRGVNSDLCRCKFAIMNPERTYTLSRYQTAAGATDIMMHTMERYFSNYTDMTLTDALSEALLRTVKESVFEVLKESKDYRYRAQLMWASSLSHNDLTECGSEKDFASHKLEHELSGMFGVTHGAGLAAIWPSWARYVMNKHVERFVQFAVNVMGITNDFAHPLETAEKGITAIEQFFHEIGMPTSIHELLEREITDVEIDILADKCSHQHSITIGALEVLDWNDMKAIYSLAR